MRTHISRTGAAAALLALLTTTTLAACGGEEPSSGSDASSEPADSGPAESESADSGDGSSDQSADGAAAEAPEPAADEQVVELGSEASFFAPKEWESIDPAELAKDKKALNTMAKEMNLPPEAALSALQASEMFIRNPEISKNFAENINVTRVPASIDQLDTDTLSSQLGSVGMKDIEVTEVETPAGPGFRVAGVLELATRGTIASDGVFVGVGDEVINVTVSTLDPATSAEVADRVVESFSTGS